MAGKRDALRRSSTTPSNITDLMQRMAAGVTEDTALSAVDWLRKSPTALIIDTELNEDEWFALLASIETIKKRYQWYLGDAMVYGIRREYGATDDQIQRVVELTGKDDKTLHDYYKTALLFEVSERSDNLEFEQHRVIARAFSEDTPEHRAERLRWLHLAETQRMSGRKLNSEIALSKLPATTSPLDIEMPGGVTIERVDPPYPDEEAVDLPREPSPLEAQANRIAMGNLWTVVERKQYQTMTKKDADVVRRKIATVRQWLVLLESQLPRK